MLHLKRGGEFMGVLKRFVKLIDKREALIKCHYGDDLRIMLNFPKEREWYTNNIGKIDKSLIILARTILPDEKFNHISDVYNNEFLTNKYNEYKAKNKEPQR